MHCVRNTPGDANYLVESQGFSKQTFVFFGYFPKCVTDLSLKSIEDLN